MNDKVTDPAAEKTEDELGLAAVRLLLVLEKMLDRHGQVY